MYTLTSKCPPPPPPDCRKQNNFSRPVARIGFGGAGPPKKWSFWTHKVNFLNLTPLTLLQKPHFVAKSGLFARFGGASHPLATGLDFFLPFYNDSCYFFFCCFMHGCLYSLSCLSISEELPMKNSLDFRGESMLTPSPMPPLHMHLSFNTWSLSWLW